MSSDLSTIEESIKIALDAADAATDVTSEYNKVKREHKKLETKVKQIHRYTTIIFGSSMIAAIVAMIFSSVLYFRSMSDLGVMTTTNREALVIFAENVDDLKDNVKALSVAMESQVALEKQNAVLVEELSSLRKEIAVATNALATRVLEQNQGLQEIMTKNTEQAVNIFADRIAKSFEVRVNQLNKEIGLYQKQLLASLEGIGSEGDDNGMMEAISKSQSQLTKEIRSLYKKNEEIFSKIKSSDGLIKFP